MTDQELLVWAAKAAGYEVFGYIHPKDGLDILIDNRAFVWRPLLDDGEALRLALKLELQINFVEDSDCFWVEISLPAHSNYELEQNIRVMDTLSRKNVDACTRRAITIAAARIGKNL